MGFLTELGFLLLGTICGMLIFWGILDTLEIWGFIIEEPSQTYISLIFGFLLYYLLRNSS